MSLVKLAAKTVTLITLATGCRKQELLGIHMGFIDFHSDSVTIDLQHLVKSFSMHNSNPRLQTMKIDRNIHNTNLRPMWFLEHYMGRTAELRTDPQVFISSQHPHGPLTGQQVGHLIRGLLKKIGIQRGTTPQSTRSVVSSAMFDKGVSIDTILHCCHWSSTSLFYQFYYKVQALLLQNTMLILTDFTTRSLYMLQRNPIAILLPYLIYYIILHLLLKLRPRSQILSLNNKQ